MTLSAICIAKNAATTIKRTVHSVDFADEIIVIDSNSTDQTAQLAQAAGARVITQAWQGYGKQKNIGLQHAQGEWVLFIDADEEVTPALQRAIMTTLAQPAKDFYWLRIVTVFLGRPLQHLYGHNLRLFRRAAGSWTDAAVHEQIVTRQGDRVRLHDEQSSVLTPPLMHYSHATIRSYLQRMHRYTTLDAAEMRKTGRHRSGRPIAATWTLPLRLSARQFVKLLIYRRGLFDGFAGIIWCVLSSYYEYEMGRKYLQAMTL